MLRRPGDQGCHDAFDHVEDRLLPLKQMSATLSIRPQGSLRVHPARTVLRLGLLSAGKLGPRPRSKFRAATCRSCRRPAFLEAVVNEVE